MCVLGGLGLRDTGCAVVLLLFLRLLLILPFLLLLNVGTAESPPRSLEAAALSSITYQHGDDLETTLHDILEKLYSPCLLQFNVKLNTTCFFVSSLRNCDTACV